MRKATLLFFALFASVILSLNQLPLSQAAPDTAPVSQRSSQAKPKPGAKKAGAGNKTAGQTRLFPKPKPDPTRAQTPEIDTALFLTEEFQGVQSRVPRPYAEARDQIGQLLTKYPQDTKLLRYAANLDEKLGNFDQSIAEMQQYTELRGNAPNALRRLAAFYHQRAMFADEVRTLQRLAPVALPFERDAVYQEIAKRVKQHSLQGFDLAEFYRKTIETDPNNLKLVEQYITQLTETRNYPEATRALTELQPKYPADLQYFLKTRASVYEQTQDRRRAEAVYSDAFDPLWPRPIVSDYYDLLRRIGRYRSYRRDLQEKFLRSKTADFTIATRLFNLYAYEANLEQAQRVVTEFENRRTAQKASWNRKELETLAGQCLQIGSYDLASRFLYSMYLMQGLQPGTPEREQTLARLTQLLLDAQTNGLPLSTGDISFYRDVAQIDQGAGFLNGTLSLILAGSSPQSEFKAVESSAVAYFNRAFAHRLYTGLKTEYPTSKQLPELTAKLLDAFTAMGEYEIVVKIGDEFLKQNPQLPNFDVITLKIADAEVRLNRRTSERTRLIALMDRKAAELKPGQLLMPVASKRWTYKPTPVPGETVATDGTPVEESDTEESSTVYEIYDPSEGSDSESSEYQYYDYPTDYLGNGIQPADAITYSRVLERVIASYAAEEKPQETLKFLYGEIKKHAQEEGLYEQMLKWLGQNSLVDDQLKVYSDAVRRFHTNTWYHRLARWYVRNDRKQAFEQYSRELTEILDDGDIEEYLQQFITQADPESNQNDARLYLELYRFAHDRFPTNVSFVKGLLTYYKQTKNWKEWEKLSAQYYFSDPDIREELLRWQSQSNTLRPNYEAAKSRAATSAVYNQFAADGAMWLSHHDEALTAYRELVKKYPGEPQYAERLAKMARSLGSQDIKLYEESAAAWISLAKIYPTSHTFPTQAGEVYAEMSDFKRAGEQWDAILNRERGNPETFLEVASIYWDYFQYDDAIRILSTLRQTTGSTTAYGYQMGAIYEGKNQMDRAIAEYVAVLAEVGDTRTQTVKRLRQLTPRKDYAAQIAKAFAARVAQPGANDDGQLTLGYVEYLKAVKQFDDAFALLKRDVQSRTSPEFLEAASDEFRRNRRTDEEEQTLKRLVTLARDEHEAMKYRLQLAAFYERNNQVDTAVSVMDRLTSEFATNLGVLQEATQFYWRVGLLDKSIALYQRTSTQAVGQYKRQFTLQLAKRQMDAGKLADSEKTLRTWYGENPLDIEAFTLLTKVLAESNQSEALAELYKTGLKNIATGNLSSDERRNKTADLRLGLIETLTKLKRHSEAVDQYIEIINRDPENTTALAAALRYSSRTGQMGRLRAYYTDLAQKADRNYRWNVVLGEISIYNGEVTVASDQYRQAILNEPQRLDFRSKLAGLYEQLGRYDDAVAVLRRAYEIDAGNSEWLVTLASLYIHQGKADKAVETLREAVTVRKNTLAATYFQYGQILLSAGLTKESASFFEDGVEKVRRDPYRNTISSYEAGSWLTTLALTDTPLATLNKVEALANLLTAEANKPNNAQPGTPRSSAESVRSTLREKLAEVVFNYATPTQKAELETALRKRIDQNQANTPESLANLNSLVDWFGMLGLTTAQEAALTRAKDVAYAIRTSNQDGRFHTQLQSLLGFYRSRENFKTVIQLLEAEEKREKHPGTFNYPVAIAAEYRAAGDLAGEMQTLARLYRSQSGDIVTSENAEVGRYLNLLYTQGKRAELDALAQIRSPYQLQLINFLVKRREKDLARKAMANAGLSPVWIKSRTAQLELYFRNSSPEVEPLFREVLNLRPIGEQLAQTPNQQRELMGDDWYKVASNYGVWLTLDPKRTKDASRYLLAAAEDAPKSDEAQRGLANFHRLDKRFDLAKAHIQLAKELDPAQIETYALEGSILYESGDRTGGRAVWNQMLNLPRGVSEAYVRYLEVMTEHDLFLEALPAVEDRLAARIRRSDVDPEDWAGLVRAMSATADEEPKFAKAVNDSFVRVMKAVPEDMNFGLLILNEKLVPASEKIPFLRMMHERAADTILAAYSNGDYNFNNYSYYTYYFNYSSPANVLKVVEQRWIDHLLEKKNYPEAEKTLGEMRSLRTLLFEQLRESDAVNPDEYYSDSNELRVEPTWMVMAQAVLELRTNRAAQALQRLRTAMGLDKADDFREGEMEYEGNEYSYDSETKVTYQNAYTLLVNENHQAEADALLGEFYQKFQSPNSPLSFFVGMAEIEFRRGRTTEGLAQLTRLINNRNTADAFISAAEIAAHYGQFAQAVEWRTKATRLAPLNTLNRIELARVQERVGTADAALTTLADLIDHQSTTNPERLTAIEVLGAIARRNRSAASTLMARYTSKPEYTAQLVLAQIQEATGNIGAAKSILDRLTPAPFATMARIERGQLAIREKQPETALTAYLAAIKDDPASRLSEGLAFADARPGTNLIELYLATNRAPAALRLVSTPTANESDNSDTADLTSFNYQSIVNEDNLPEPALRTLAAESRRHVRDYEQRTYPLLVEAATQAGDLSQALEFARYTRRLMKTPEMIAAADKKIEALTEQLNQLNRTSLIFSTGVTGSESLENTLGEAIARK